MTARESIEQQIRKAVLKRPVRKLALWLLEDVDQNGYTMHTPSQMTHILEGHDGPAGRVYGDTKKIYAALEALCKAGILAFTWTPLSGLGWAQDVSMAFMAWPEMAVTQ